MVTVDDILPRIQRGEEVTRQELTEAIIRFLFEQGRPSVSDGYPTQCRLRGAGETKCALGAVVPESEYQPWMDNSGVSRVATFLFCPQLKDRPFIQSLKPHTDLLTQLQDIHDCAARNNPKPDSTSFDVEYLRKAATEIALEVGISPKDLCPWELPLGTG